MVRQYNDQRKRTNNGVEKTNTSVSHWRPLIEWKCHKGQHNVQDNDVSL
jgi:hypothetical protein